MNATAYNKGQSTRVAINHGTDVAVTTVRDAGISVLSFLKGVLASPNAVPSTKTKRTAAKRK